MPDAPIGDPLAPFGPATRAFVEATFAAPTPVQAHGWAAIARGDHALLIAPTGSGKTLAAFLHGIDRLTRLPPDAPAGVRVLYVSPLKALAYDVERNLRAPLAAITARAAAAGHPIRPIAVDVRTGDTSQRDRRLQRRHPGDLLVTTPESLYLLLGSQARETLRHVDTVIIDEIHALAPTKRGAHLMLSLERLAALTDRDPQRVGLSATVRPAADVAAFLAGDRPVTVVDTAAPPRLDLQIVVPVADMTQRPPEAAAAPSQPASTPAPTARDANPADRLSLWPAIHPRILELVRAHRSTIVFVNSRSLCERLSQRLNELAGEELVRAHHGSLAHDQRTLIEEALKSGALRGLVATSSLELGIDMGAVDLVIQVESPHSAARGLQRIGRAGHQVGGVSRGRIFPKFRGDLVECAVVARQMLDGHIEALRIPRNPLDVLAQQVVAATSVDEWTVDALERLVRRCHSFRELSRELLVGVLDMLSGRYPTHEMADLRPRLVWDREADTLRARRDAARIAITSGGTIPDRGLYAVHVGEGGPRVGELDEEMVYETRPGQTFLLGASSWRVEAITRDRVIVAPAPGEPGRMPFWRGEGPGRPLETGRAIGAFLRELSAMEPADAPAWLTERFALDPLAAQNLVSYVAEQRAATGTVPSDRAITVERFRDELGDWRVCVLSPFGARVHAPWAMALEATLSRRAGYEVQALYSDDGLVLRFADAEAPPDASLLVPDPDEVEDLVVEQVGQSALFAGLFRENAGRALLIPRRRPGQRTPLWAQRLKAQHLLSVARQFPAFPIMLETYRGCLQDVFDLPALIELLRDVRRRAVRVEEVETRAASPFARSLVFAYVAAYLYEGDAPLAERKAQALTLDRTLLRELLGQAELRDLLDPDAIDEVEAELQGRAEGFQARHADGLHDLLRRVGDLTPVEVAARCADDPTPWLEQLAAERRAFRMAMAGESRWVAAEDVARFRDALAVPIPDGVPDAYLTAAPNALEALVTRYLRTHGPFVTAAPAARWALPAARVEAVLRELERRHLAVLGELRPSGTIPEWCDPDVLRRLRRRTLARLRHQVAPVEAPALGRFLPQWHGLDRHQRGPHRLLEVVAQLEGAAIAFSDLERRVLPARVADYQPRMLDELGASGFVVWVGRGALGASDGRVALYRRERAALLIDPPPPYEPPTPLHDAVLRHLVTRGASFFAELVVAAGHPRQDELLPALWDLVWAGLVTNDTFAALRGLGAAKKKGARASASASRAMAGRWSAVAQLAAAPDTPQQATASLHARATMLLDRYGLVSREAANAPHEADALAGGFQPLYSVFKAMAEAGRVRRGYFVEGLSGAQFALAGALDRLREAPHPDATPAALVLAATDPANPYGALLPWPETLAPDQQPRRAAGATLVLVDGAPALFLERGARRLVTFPVMADPTTPAAHAAAAALRQVAARTPRRFLRLEKVDAAPARTSPLTPLLVAVGFTSDPAGLVLEAAL